MEISQGVIDAHAELVKLNARAKAACAAFYMKRRRHIPHLMPRLVQVVPKGRNFFHLVDAYTDKVIGFRTGHRAACAAARDLERGAA
ncbi:hypothetical protein LF844_09730 [Metapseudomonas lalkuanensis]|uniref:hypothetical protein n=1 Tax=Metapseudomonas lalkuanensis TaxID=2604832 RepID=UPI001CF48FAB|nr:hypothetical protein [Pseudomonas lalkuanensis]UCP00069.1 hypothetical protein LF844_09730 [Pseudomonas lalkuanensis]